MIESLNVRWTDGPMAAAAQANLDGRLLEFVEDENSDVLQMFSPGRRAISESGDWYGEHAGKWLVAASQALARTGDARLKSRIEMACEFLVSSQEDDGYLGTYSPSSLARFTAHPGPGFRTWDLWNHAWLILGFLAVNQLEPARKIGDLLVQTFTPEAPALIRQGNHKGLSSLVVLEPLAKLSAATGDERFLDLAFQTLAQAEASGLNVAGWAEVPDLDPSTVGSGKIYQMLWVFRGMLAMHRCRPTPRLHLSVERAWEVIRNHHLDPTGGPWGGIAAHKEVFNPSGFFSPRGLVETCSSATWLSLTHDLYVLDGDSRRVDEIEKTLLNSILGAQSENGRDWIYFSFPNGRRNHTYHWACCKSSGALALEAAAEMVLSRRGEELRVDLLLPCETDDLLIEIGEGAARFTAKAGPLHLELRVPGWLESGSWGESGEGYAQVDLRAGETVSLPLRERVRVEKKTFTLDHHGQEIVREDYVAVAKGPYVYALEGRDDRSFRLPFLDPTQALRVRDVTSLDLIEPGRPPQTLRRYFEAGDRRDGAYRTTWIPVEWQ